MKWILVIYLISSAEPETTLVTNPGYATLAQCESDGREARDQVDETNETLVFFCLEDW